MDATGDRVVIDKSEDGKHSIQSPINAKYLTIVENTIKKFEPYLVRVNVGLLNYRQGPGLTYRKNGKVKRGEIFTIIEEKDDWGRLKSGAGWIYLPYTKKI
jgi:uncharacterized protein YgiM (DUF1202 family)